MFLEKIFKFAIIIKLNKIINKNEKIILIIIIKQFYYVILLLYILNK